MISKKPALLILIFITVCSGLYGQVITLVDSETNQPIELATIASNNPKATVTTDFEGRADISILQGANFIEIRHISYKNFKTNYIKLSSGDKIIRLVPNKLAIDEVVISANKWEQSVYEIPNKIIGIDANDIQFSNPQTSADILTSTGEVFVQKSQYGGGSPKLRGFAANSVLMVIDGVRMNNAIYRSGNLQNIISIDPNSLEGAEVVLGPGSVIYGSDALGGVMDFHTKDPKYAYNDSMTVSGSVLGRYSSAGNENTLHTELNLGWKKIASYSSFSFSSFGDLKAGSKRTDGYDNYGQRTFFVEQDPTGADIIVPNTDPDMQIGSGFDSRNFIQKLSYRVNDQVELSYGIYYSSTSDIPRYDRLVETDENGTPNDAEWYYGPQKWLMHNARLKMVRPTSFFTQMKVTAAFQDYEESRIDRGFNDTRLRTRTEKVGVYSLNIDLDKELPKGNLFYGAEILYNDIESEAIRVDQLTGEITFPSTRYPDGGSEYTSYAAYANYKWNIADQFTLNTGLRYSLIQLNANLSNQSALSFPFDKLSLENDAFNGSLGLVYSPSRNLKLNLALASGFRAPNVDDVGKVFDFSDGEVQVPNANLQSEYSYNIEAGIETKIGSNWEVGITGFYTLLEDAMVRRNFTFNGQDSIIYEGELSKVVALTNTGQAEIYGLSFETEYEISDALNLNGSLTWVDGEDKSNNEPLRHTTPIFGRVSLDYIHNQIRSSIYSEFNGSRFRKDIPSSEIDDKPFLYAQHNTDRSKDGTPGWATLNWKMSYSISNKVEVSGGIENIFDLHYRPYSSGISAPGRNFIIALRAQLY